MEFGYPELQKAFNIRGRYGGAFGAEEEEEEEEAVEGQDGKPRYKGGLPVRRVGDDQSMLYYRITFSSLGLAEMPDLDVKAKTLLGIR